MSADRLKERLLLAAGDLDEIGKALASGPARITPRLDQILQNSVGLAHHLRDAASLIEIRTTGAAQLEEIRKSVNPARDEVVFHEATMPFAHARLLGFQGYLATTWAISDHVMRSVGALMCTKETARNREKPPQLWSHVFASSVLSSATGDLLREAYGWPIAVSYATRNHCLHDAGIVESRLFFEGPRASDGFRVSKGGWDFLSAKAQADANVKPTNTRLSLEWPWHVDNLLEHLVVCHEELDRALGMLARWAATAAKMQAAVLLDEDI